MKPLLSFWQIVNMNVGFLGIQFSFGLQQSNMSPIYQTLGADEKSLPLLWLAGPLTGLIVQPIIGALSDRTTSRWGRRTPYFLIGAILCSLGLILMPMSPTLWSLIAHMSPIGSGSSNRHEGFSLRAPLQDWLRLSLISHQPSS
jgi:maltose/moltooligosaccharide transporter